MNEDINRKTFADMTIIFVLKIPLWIAFAGLLHLYTAEECSSHNKTLLMQNTHRVYYEAP